MTIELAPRTENIQRTFTPLTNLQEAVGKYPSSNLTLTTSWVVLAFCGKAEELSNRLQKFRPAIDLIMDCLV